MALVSDLVVKLSLDNRNFNSALNTSHSEMNKLRDSFKEKLIEIASIASIAAGFHALAKSISDTTERVSTLVDTATGLDITVESLQRLQYAADQNSISADSFAGYMSKLQKTLVEATADTKTADAAISGLSLKYKDLIGIPLDQQFLKIAQAIKETKDPADQARAAYELFGKGGTKVLTLMRDDVAGLGEEFEKLGAGISGKQAAAIESYGDKVNKMKIIWSGFGTQMTVQLIPILDFINQITSDLIISWGGWGKIGQSVGNVILTSMIAVTDVIIASVKGMQALDIAFLKFEQTATRVSTLGLSTVFGEGDKRQQAQIDEAQKTFDDPAMQKFRDSLADMAIKNLMADDAIVKKVDVNRAAAKNFEYSGVSGSALSAANSINDKQNYELVTQTPEQKAGDRKIIVEIKPQDNFIVRWFDTEEGKRTVKKFNENQVNYEAMGVGE